MADDALTATLAALADASERARSIEAEIRALAARAATEGASYGDIGRTLGITRQGARKRFPRLLDTRHPATTTVVSPAEYGVGRPPDRATGDTPDKATHGTTTTVAATVNADRRPTGHQSAGGTERRAASTPTGPAKPSPRSVDPTTTVAAPEEPNAPRHADRPEQDAARLPASRPRRAEQPRARAGTSALDNAMGAVAAMSKDTGYTLERTETGYRVLVGGVPCGTLRPDYTGTSTNRPRGWLPMAPGPVSVFPPGRSYGTRDEAVTHLLADLRHRAEQQRGKRGRARSGRPHPTPAVPPEIALVIGDPTTVAVAPAELAAPDPAPAQPSTAATPVVAVAPGPYAWVAGRRAAGVSWPEIGRATGLSAGEARRRWEALDVPVPAGSPAAHERASRGSRGSGAVPALSAAIVDLAAARMPGCADCTAADWAPCAAHLPPLAIRPARGPRWATGVPTVIRPAGRSGGTAGVVAAIVGWNPTTGQWVYRITAQADGPTQPAVPSWCDETSLHTPRPRRREVPH